MTGDEVIKLRDQLKAARSPLESHWDELAELFMPFRLQEGGLPDILEAERVFDSSGRQAAIILANGLASLIFPREEEWFEFAPPNELRDDDDAISFYREASPRVREALEESNFFEEAQECVIESPVFGTTALFVGDAEEATGEIYFSNQPIGTYYIAEDHRGRVVTMVRELDLTAEQARAEFGEENLPQRVRDQIGKPGGFVDKHRFIHAIVRNPKVSKDEEAYKAKPFLSCVAFEPTKEKVAESGFDEFPFAVHRYRKFGRCPWGFGPGTIAKGDARQLNFLNELADVATEKDIFPPVVADAALEGEVAQGALEITYVEGPEMVNGVKEWARPGGKYHALERIQEKRRSLEETFHVDLFKLFSLRAQERGPLTATEASLVAGEKLAQFSPVFGRLVSEFLDPVLNRVFMLLWRAGKLPDAPSVVAKYLKDGTVTGIAKPAVRYKNKIVLAMQARENSKLMEFFQFAGPILQVYPGASDALEPDVMVRDVARNGGLPEPWIASEKIFKARQQARAEAAQREAQLQEAQMSSQAAANMGRAPEQMQQMIGQQIGQR